MSDMSGTVFAVAALADALFAHCLSHKDCETCRVIVAQVASLPKPPSPPTDSVTREHFVKTEER